MLVGLSAGCLVCWLVGWLDVLLIGWSVRAMVGCLSVASVRGDHICWYYLGSANIEHAVERDKEYSIPYHTVYSTVQYPLIVSST